MKIRITPPERINATIQLPSSKSISNRALIISALGNGEHQLENLSDCDDTQVMIRALHAQPGETIEEQYDTLEVLEIESNEILDTDSLMTVYNADSVAVEILE